MASVDRWFCSAEWKWQKIRALLRRSVAGFSLVFECSTDAYLYLSDGLAYIYMLHLIDHVSRCTVETIAMKAVI